MAGQELGSKASTLSRKVTRGTSEYVVGHAYISAASNNRRRRQFIFIFIKRQTQRVIQRRLAPGAGDVDRRGGARPSTSGDQEGHGGREQF